MILAARLILPCGQCLRIPRRETRGHVSRRGVYLVLDSIAPAAPVNPGARPGRGNRPSLHVPLDWVSDKRLSNAALGLLIRLEADIQRHGTSVVGHDDLVDELAATGYIEDGYLVDPFDQIAVRPPTNRWPMDREDRAVQTGSVIYFARACDGLIKIGVTKNLLGRLAGLSRLNGQLDVLGVEPGSWRRERAIHDAFAHLRVYGLPPWRGTEWFQPATDLLSHIESLAATP